MAEFQKNGQPEKSASELTIRELALSVTALKDTLPEGESELLNEAAKQLQRLQRLSELLGLLAPGGTAPRTGFEQLWIQSGENSSESPILLELRAMLQKHWGDWTPALREAEGLPPKEKSGDERLLEKEAELRELLRDAYIDYGENSPRAYFPERGERDTNDHHATIALHVFRPLLKEIVDREL